MSSTTTTASTDAGGCEDGVCVPKGSKTTSSSSMKNEETAAASSDEANKNASTNNRKDRIKIDIISDTMCPWCWVGKRNLEQAIRQQQEKSKPVQVDITWHPFFLDRHLPEQGKPVEEYYADNYGNPKIGERFKPQLIRAGRACGIDFETHYVKLTHYRPTIKSHVLIEIAKEQSKQDAMVDALFDMYYQQEGKHLNCDEHLLEVARKVGIEGNVVAMLNDPARQQQVDQAAAHYKRYANGVPTFLFSKPDWETKHKRPLSFSGGQPPEAFLQVFEMLLEE